MKKKNQSLSALIQAGKQNEEIIKNSTSETILNQSSTTPIVNEKIEAEPIIIEKKIEVKPPIQSPTIVEPPVIEEESLEQISFSKYIAKRQKEDDEAIRIPKSNHKDLKFLATIYGVTINSIASNIIEEVMKKHEKEIKKLIKAGLS